MKDRKATQCDKILAYMKLNGSITQAEATHELNTYRLAARISDLKKKGYDITSKMVEEVNKDGERVRFYCSSCNGWNTYGKSKYCPNCGAKMEDDAR